jgi:hypothetical protein
MSLDLSKDIQQGFPVPECVREELTFILERISRLAGKGNHLGSSILIELIARVKLQEILFA